MQPRTPNAAAAPAEIRRQIIEGLTQAGFAVMQAQRLNEALAALQRQWGVLVLLDLMDPQAGAQLVEELRATVGGNQQPVLLLSPVERVPPERQLLE